MKLVSTANDFADYFLLYITFCLPHKVPHFYLLQTTQSKSESTTQNRVVSNRLASKTNFLVKLKISKFVIIWNKQNGVLLLRMKYRLFGVGTFYWCSISVNVLISKLPFEKMRTIGSKDIVAWDWKFASKVHHLLHNHTTLPSCARRCMQKVAVPTDK